MRSSLPLRVLDSLLDLAPDARLLRIVEGLRVTRGDAVEQQILQPLLRRLDRGNDVVRQLADISDCGRCLWNRS